MVGAFSLVYVGQFALEKSGTRLLDSILANASGQEFYEEEDGAGFVYNANGEIINKRKLSTDPCLSGDNEYYCPTNCPV